MGKILLLVEDEQLQIDVLKGKFSEEGYDVVVAEDGAKGLKTALETHPDIIVLDIILPKLTGLEMLEELRKDTWGETANVIILTNLTNLDGYRDILGKETDHLIKTEASLDEIIEKVKGYSN